EGGLNRVFYLRMSDGLRAFELIQRSAELGQLRRERMGPRCRNIIWAGSVFEGCLPERFAWLVCLGGFLECLLERCVLGEVVAWARLVLGHRGPDKREAKKWFHGRPPAKLSRTACESDPSAEAISDALHDAGQVEGRPDSALTAPVFSVRCMRASGA